jgi:hypothetical protein
MREVQVVDLPAHMRPAGRFPNAPGFIDLIEPRVTISLQRARELIRVINAKSDAGNRIIPMNTTVYSLLSELAERERSPLVFPSNRKPGEKFLDLKKGIHKAVCLAGIPHIRLHDMRHTFATRLIRAGVDIVIVQKLLGHSKITMTARYAHSLADAKMAAVSKLDFAVSCSSPDSNRTPPPTPAEPAQSLSNLDLGT